MPFQTEANEKILNDNEVPKYENTYRMEPRSFFKTDSIDKITMSVMNNHLNDLTYDDAESVKVCSDITSEIRRHVKKLGFDRHKIVVIVTIIEKASQSVETSLGCLWDGKRDNHSTFFFEGRTFHAHCCVFALYYE